MKKPSFEFISQLIFMTVGFSLLIAGLIKFAYNSYASLPISIPILIAAVGFILINQANAYFSLLQVLDGFNNILKEITKQQPKTSPQNIQDLYNLEIPEIKRITITDKTTPEELDEIKQQFPMLAKDIDDILNSEGLKLKPTEKIITTLTDEELEKILGLYIEDDNFEKAAEIRDEINKRKQNKL